MKKTLFILFFIFLVIGETASAANSGKIYFSGPATVSLTEPDFMISVFLDTEKPVNAVDLTIFYPQDKLKFLSFNNTRSIVNLWQTWPAISSSGDIILAGGILNPFTGKDGLIIKIAFKALSAGELKLSFKKNSVYIADGKGTKLSLPAKPSIFEITATPLSAPLLNQEGDGSGNYISPTDSSPPEILLERTESLIDGSSLIIFNAVDAESGIEKTQVRTKKWWLFSDWRDAINPILYPEGVWNLEFKAENNAGLESVKSLFWRGEFYKKLLISFFFFLILLFIIVWVYNRGKRKI